MFVPRRSGDEFLFGEEHPGELIEATRVEVDFDPPRLVCGYEPLWVEFAYADLWCTGEPCGGTEKSVQWDGRVREAREEDYDGRGVHEE